MKLTSWLLILLIIAVLLPMTIVSVVLIMGYQQAYTNAILSREQEVVARLADSIDSFVLEQGDMIQLAGSTFLQQAWSPTERVLLQASGGASWLTRFKAC